MKFKPSIMNHLSGSISAALLVLSPGIVLAAEPDLTAAGVIAGLKHKGADGRYDGHVQYGVGSSRSYDDTYNLGATGMRGWIYDYNANFPFGSSPTAEEIGLATEFSRKILVTTVEVNSPAYGKLQQDDVILGVSWGNAPVQNFSKDARKSFGQALNEAERIINGGALNVRVWRAGSPATITDKTLWLAPIDTYTDTAPYNCPKSKKILEKARAQLVIELRANAEFLTGGHSSKLPNGYIFSGAGAVNGLALLAAVPKYGSNGLIDPDYDYVQARLRAMVAELGAPDLDISATEDKPIWRLAYQNIFLCEYYMRSKDDADAIRKPDMVALDKLKKYTIALARAQGKFGTFGHGGSLLTPGGGLHGVVPFTGAINCAGIAANLSLVLGKMANLRDSNVIDSEIQPAIDRANQYFGYYVNKGTIPYGEHRPGMSGHSYNGKDEMLAVMFALQGNHQTETEYFSRMSVAGFNGRELGHNGNGFNFLWEGIAANVGGPTAASAYFKEIKWSLDLERRTDGSFSYDGQRTAAYGGSNTGDGTYLGLSEYYGMNPTAWHILTYGAPLKSLYITGKIPFTTTLSPDAVSNAIAAGGFQLISASASNDTLVTKLGDYDPIVREEAAKQLKIRMTSAPLTTTQINSLVASITTASLGATNMQIGACRILGLLKTPSALQPLVQRLSDSNLWVRASAATALADWGPADSGQINTMLGIYANNATDPNIINWSDPIQVANGLLSDALFKTRPNKTIEAPSGLLYPAIKIALKQPDSIPRMEAAQFTSDYFSYYDAKTLIADLVECVTTRSQANFQTSMLPRDNAMKTLVKFRFIEGIPAAMALLDVPRAFDWQAGSNLISGLEALASYGDASNPQLGTLRAMEIAWPNSGTPQLIEKKPKLSETIAKIVASTANSSNDIITFQFPSLAQPMATISGTNITIQVPTGTDVTQLSPTYTFSSTAKAVYNSGMTRNFTTPQAYPIIASDRNLTAKIYTVSVNFQSVTPPPSGITALTGVTAWGPNRVDTFTIGADKTLFWKYWDGSNWSPYSSLSANTSAGVGATNWGVNRLDVFYSGNTGSMRHKWYTGNWSQEEDLGGVLVGAPAATSWATNRIDVFCRGTDNRLYWNYYDGSWSTWKAPAASADVYSSPAVTNWGPNRLDVFYAGINGSLRHKWYTGSWSPEEDLGGVILGAPAAVAWNNNRIDVIVRGSDNQLYWKFWDGSSWSGFNWLSAFTYSDPTVTSRGNNAFDIFYRGPNGAMKQKSFNAGAWSVEYDHGIPTFSGVTARAGLHAVVTNSVLAAPNVPLVSANSTATVLQAPWTIGSIGNGLLTGTSVYNAGTISQSGSGSLGMTRDKLNFSYQMLSGDGEITAEINALQNTGTFSGVGVMIRDTLATNSKHVFMGMTGTNSYVTASRTTTGGIATVGKTGTGMVPNTWVKLARVGNVITASKSLDGRTWTAVSSTKVVMGTNCYIGLAVSSGSDSVLNNSQFTHLSVTP
jgi:Family of unknown function (DUF6288)/HEAT repeats